jgi:hypothetical protein
MKDKGSRPSTSHNSGYAVRAAYRPLPNCPTLRFGQLRIATDVSQNRFALLLNVLRLYRCYPCSYATSANNDYTKFTSKIYDFIVN